MPADRQVQVRTPKFKMKLVGSTPLNSTTAHNGSKAARVGAHNDCFVASSSDQGTFNSDTERSFWAADTRYTIMGGETCAVSDQCHCAAYGSNPGTLSELKKYHWTNLHDGYNQNVLDLWKSEGCFEQVDRELGYRLVLEDGAFGAAKAGSPMQVTIHLRNKGYAAPMNPRTAYLVLTSSSGSVLQSWALDSDPRFWGPDDGLITISKSITMPSGASGAVKLNLYLPDPESTLSSDPSCATRTVSGMPLPSRSCRYRSNSPLPLRSTAIVSIFRPIFSQENATSATPSPSRSSAISFHPLRTSILLSSGSFLILFFASRILILLTSILPHSFLTILFLSFLYCFNYDPH
jgi:hypothetical protein